MMHIWQAAWDVSGRFLLWSERSIKLDSESNINGRDSRVSPSACTREELLNDLALLDFEPYEAIDIEVSLPTRNGLPYRSPMIEAREGIAEAAEIDFAVWSFPGWSLTPLEAVSLLTSLPEELPSGIRFDDSVKFWREATKLLLQLLTKGSFLPGLIREGTKYRSVWHPVFQRDEDRAAMAVLAEGIPPICHMLATDEVVKDWEPKVLLESFLAAGANGLIRLFMKHTNLRPEISSSQVTPRIAAHLDWLRSLTDGVSTVLGLEHELSKLEQRLRIWGGAFVAETQGHELRTTFRVIPPLVPVEDDQAEIWTLDFLLQSTTDYNSSLSARDIWDGKLGFLSISEYNLEELEGILLRDLGRASKLFPELKRALTVSHPEQLMLTTVEVYNFLREASKQFEQLGFGVVVPTWWEKPTAQLGLKLEVRPGEGSEGPNNSYLATHQLLDFSWQVSLGEEELSSQEFRKLIEKQVPLLQIRGQWVELEPKKMKATLRFLEEQEGRKKISFLEAIHFGLGIDQQNATLPVVGFTARGWIEQLLNADNTVFEMLAEPQGFKGELRPYQREGLSWLSFRSQLGIGACLADDMGLGKTVQLLAYLVYEHERNQAMNATAKKRPLLLIVPMSILANWEQEARRFAPALEVYVHHGVQRLTSAEFFKRVSECDLVITTYSLAFRDEELLSAVGWSGMALDEAQNIKNLDTKQTKAIRRLCHEQLSETRGIAPFQRFALTGTPLENHLEEVWSIFDFLNPGFLGSVSEFRTRFAVPIERFRDKEAAQSLSRLLQPFVLRRLKSDPKIITDLPEKLEMDVVIPLSREQAAMYQAAVDEMLPQVEAATGMHRKGLVLSTITKLKQICDHPVLYLKDGTEVEGRSHKIARLVQLLEVVVAEGDKALVFTQFAQLGHLLKPYLQERLGTEVLFLHGALPRKAREKLVERFQEKSGPPIFLLSLKAGGFGLNLTEANQVIHLDQWWNPAVENQATDRAYRIGQKRNVQVRKLICQGTLEERIAAMLKQKQELADQIVGSTKDSITQLSTDELRKLLEFGGGPLIQEGETVRGVGGGIDGDF